MKNKNGVSFGLLSGIFWGLGLTISAYIFSIFTNLSPFVVAAAHDFLSIFILLAFLLIKEGNQSQSYYPQTNQKKGKGADTRQKRH